MTTDPILAAIEAHRAALAAFETVGNSMKPGTLADDDTKMAALSETANSAAWAMLDCEPASMAGVVDLLDYVNGVDPGSWPERAGDAPFVAAPFAADLLRFTAKQAKRLSGLNGACPHCGSKGHRATFNTCCGVPV